MTQLAKADTMEPSTAKVFARLRPLAKSGGHKARREGGGKRDVRQLGGFDCDSVTMVGGGGERKFDYMDRVLLPEEDQQMAYTAMGLPDMLEKFFDGYDVTFIAYGQTGTGKTHTLFGSELEAEERGWGDT